MPAAESETERGRESIGVACKYYNLQGCKEHRQPALCGQWRPPWCKTNQLHSNYNERKQIGDKKIIHHGGVKTWNPVQQVEEARDLREITVIVSHKNSSGKLRLQKTSTQWEDGAQSAAKQCEGGVEWDEKDCWLKTTRPNGWVDQWYSEWAKACFQGHQNSSCLRSPT